MAGGLEMFLVVTKYKTILTIKPNNWIKYSFTGHNICMVYSSLPKNGKPPVNGIVIAP